MSKASDMLDAITLALAPRKKTIVLDPRDDNSVMLDRAVDAFHAEADRWNSRWNDRAYELVRNSSPDNDICDEEYSEIIRFTKYECPDGPHAYALLNTYRDRAAMLAALRAL